MDTQQFSKVVAVLGRGELVVAHTQRSDCLGYYEGYYPKANVPFIVLAATKKKNQGRDGEHWYDHTYSVPVERITALTRLEEKQA